MGAHDGCLPMVWNSRLSRREVAGPVRCMFVPVIGLGITLRSSGEEELEARSVAM